MSYVDIGETTVYYETKGTGEPIVFIHPPAMGHVTFKKQSPLAEDFQTITFDMRGHGQSGYIKGEKVTVSMIADDIQRILDDLDIDKAVLCGYSNGGSMALEFALKYPERVNGIILSGGFSEVNSFLLKNQFELGIGISKVNAISFLGNMLSISHTKEKEFRKEISSYVQETNSKILYDLYCDGLEYNCSDQLSSIKAPILLVYGNRDFYIHHYQTIFLKNHPKTDVVYISGIGHQIPTRRPDEFNRVVKDYVRTLH